MWFSLCFYCTQKIGFHLELLTWENFSRPFQPPFSCVRTGELPAARTKAVPMQMALRTGSLCYIMSRLIVKNEQKLARSSVQTHFSAEALLPGMRQARKQTEPTARREFVSSPQLEDPPHHLESDYGAEVTEPVPAAP